MADFSRKIKSDNSHLACLTSARFVHIDGGVTTPVTIPSTEAKNLLRIVLNTNGSTLLVRTGSRVVASIASDAPEQTFDYGVYCENGITYEAGGALSATLVFDR
jgi:hypothetical protein